MRMLIAITMTVSDAFGHNEPVFDCGGRVDGF